MSALPVTTLAMSVAEYLATEPFNLEKREYLAGMVYDMAGASEAHGVIAMNLYGMLHSQLRGKTCQPFSDNMQLRLRRPGGTYYYYPDALISCDKTDSPGQRWKERPAALFEILSDSTRAIDEREKRTAYLDLASLQAYVRIEQAGAAVAVDWRDAEGEWQMADFRGLGAVVILPMLKIELPLSELYERLDFTV